MYSMIEGVYDAFTELMHYFYFEFNIYLIIFFIIFINCIRAFLCFRRAKNEIDVENIPDAWAVIVSMILGMGLFNALLFQGVISDISGEQSAIWFPRVLILCIGSFVLFIIQFICCIKTVNKDKNK